MDWIASNAIGLIALTVSTITASIQISNWRAGRHKVTAHAWTSTVGIPVPDGSARNHTYMTLSVRNTGRAISVVNVEFDVLGSSQARLSQNWSTSSFNLNHMDTTLQLPSRFTRAALIPDGGSEIWKFELDADQPVPHPRESTQFIAKVELSNGRTIESQPFWHSQSPTEGWTSQDFLGS